MSVVLSMGLRNQNLIKFMSMLYNNNNNNNNNNYCLFMGCVHLLNYG